MFGNDIGRRNGEQTVMHDELSMTKEAINQIFPNKTKESPRNKSSPDADQSTANNFRGMEKVTETPEGHQRASRRTTRPPNPSYLCRTGSEEKRKINWVDIVGQNKPKSEQLPDYMMGRVQQTMKMLTKSKIKK